MTAEYRPSFKEVLKRERQKRGWTQQYVAEQLGVDVNTVSRWERSNHLPQLSLHVKLQNLFSMTLTELGLVDEKTGPIAENSVHTIETEINLTLVPVEASIDEVSVSGLSVVPRNPYKGLRAFHEEDAGDFFGRQQLFTEIIERLREILLQNEQASSCSRLLTVVGPSGSGKSSVIRAGLLPHLKADAVPGSQDWVYLPVIEPGSHPVEALAAALSKYLPHRKLTSIYEDIHAGGARGLHTLASRLALSPETRVVLCIDQFEELFTQTNDEQERQQFIDLLVMAASESRGPLLVILALRADFYDRPLHYPALGKLLTQRQISVFPLSAEELQSAIEQPATLTDVQLTFEDGLVSEMLMAMQGQRGALPLLQFTLDQLFEQRNNNVLTRHAYDTIGGITGALSQHAERTYTNLPSNLHKEMVRVLFLRLIVQGTTEQETARRCAIATDFSLTDQKHQLVIQEVITAFTEARLLTMATNEYGEVTIEVSHEALIREWKRYVDWQQKYRWDTYLQEHIHKDAVAWETYGKRRDRLYRGSQLIEAQAWAKRNPQNEREYVFLRASAKRQLRTRIYALAGITLLVILLVPFIATLLGMRTFLSSPVVPGGWWISPEANAIIHNDTVHFAAYAYPSLPTSPSVAYVEFTMRWNGPYAWFTACHITTDRKSVV